MASVSLITPERDLRLLTYVESNSNAKQHVKNVANATIERYILMVIELLTRPTRWQLINVTFHLNIHNLLDEPQIGPALCLRTPFLDFVKQLELC